MTASIYQLSFLIPVQTTIANDFLIGWRSGWLQRRKGKGEGRKESERSKKGRTERREGKSGGLKERLRQRLFDFPKQLYLHTFTNWIIKISPQNNVPPRKSKTEQDMKESTENEETDRMEGG